MPVTYGLGQQLTVWYTGSQFTAEAAGAAVIEQRKIYFEEWITRRALESQWED